MNVVKILKMFLKPSISHTLDSSLIPNKMNIYDIYVLPVTVHAWNPGLFLCNFNRGEVSPHILHKL